MVTVLLEVKNCPFYCHLDIFTACIGYLLRCLDLKVLWFMCGDNNNNKTALHMRVRKLGVYIYVYMYIGNMHMTR